MAVGMKLPDAAGARLCRRANVGRLPAGEYRYRTGLQSPCYCVNLLVIAVMAGGLGGNYRLYDLIA